MTWSRILPVAVFFVLVVFLAIGLTRDPSVIPTEMIDREMPSFELPELREDDVMIAAQDLVGETTLVNVFGSWCVACLQEHPTLMQLSRDRTVRIDYIDPIATCCLVVSALFDQEGLLLSAKSGNIADNFHTDTRRPVIHVRNRGFLYIDGS